MTSTQVVVLCLLLLLPLSRSFRFRTALRRNVASVGRLRMLSDSEEYGSRSGRLMNKLFNKAASLAASIYESDTSDDSHHTSILSTSSATQYSRRIPFQNISKARSYLSLPPSEYSVLNASWIKKSSTKPDVFELSIPLDRVSYAIENIVPQWGFGELQNYVLVMDVQVKCNPMGQKISMTSGPVYFARNHHRTLQETTPSALIPRWLTWFDASKAEPKPHLGNLILSSLQPVISIDWSWSPQSQPSSSQLLTSIYSMFGMNRDSPAVSPSDVLITNFKVDAKLDMSAPVAGRHGRTLSALPVKLLLQRAMSMVMYVFLVNLTPMFQEMLLRDFEKWSQR